MTNKVIWHLAQRRGGRTALQEQGLVTFSWLDPVATIRCHQKLLITPCHQAHRRGGRTALQEQGLVTFSWLDPVATIRCHQKLLITPCHEVTSA
jgi:hypothetical protein